MGGGPPPGQPAVRHLQGLDGQADEVDDAVVVEGQFEVPVGDQRQDHAAGADEAHDREEGPQPPQELPVSGAGEAGQRHRVALDDEHGPEAPQRLLGSVEHRRLRSLHVELHEVEAARDPGPAAQVSSRAEGTRHFPSPTWDPPGYDSSNVSVNSPSSR